MHAESPIAGSLPWLAWAESGSLGPTRTRESSGGAAMSGDGGAGCRRACSTAGSAGGSGEISASTDACWSLDKAKIIWADSWFRLAVSPFLIPGPHFMVIEHLRDDNVGENLHPDIPGITPGARRLVLLRWPAVHDLAILTR